MLWVDKHRPSRLEELSYHNDTITSRLSALVSRPASLPHLFFHGPSGSGKATRIAALLQAVYGNGALKLRLDKRTFTTPTNRTIEINMVTSNYHIELCPGDAGLNDRYVVQQIIQEIASTKNIASSASSSHNIRFKIVVLKEVDRLSKQAQAALRRTMEKYAASCRLILVSQSVGQVMEPLRSRCLAVRIPQPSEEEICRVLQSTAKKEKIGLPDELAINIARESSRNLRRALLMLEACHVAAGGSELKPKSPIQKTDWELYIHQLAQDVTKEQSPQRLLAAREKLYELLVHCIPASVILKTLVKELMMSLDDELKPEVVYWAAFYEHRIAASSSNKEIFHLEAFLAKYMAIYKKYLNDMFG